MSNGLVGFIKIFFQDRFNSWLTKRIPAAEQHILSQKNIFIFPTRFGFGYLLFVLVLFLLATNYQNNIVMLLSYLLASVFVSAMMMSFFNLSGLTVKVQTKLLTNIQLHSYGFAQQLMYFPVTISSNSTRPNSQRRFSLVLSFDCQEQTMANTPTKTITVLLENDLLVEVPCFAMKRGHLSPGRLIISSEYCFGLFVTWTRLDFDFHGLVYPKPTMVNGSLLSLTAIGDDDDLSNNLTTIKGDDEFYELKSYRTGEPLSRIAWKQFAKGQGKFTKHYQQNQGQPCWLVLADMPANNLESKLELMCFLILEYEQTTNDYGIDLGTIKLGPSQGGQHKQDCLSALAQYH